MEVHINRLFSGVRMAETTTNRHIDKALADVKQIFEEDLLDENALNAIKSQAVRDIFGPGANPRRRYVADYDHIARYAEFLKGLGLSVVYTPGVWDLPHIGHCRYMQRAKQLGDILIVGVEMDEAVRIRKGPKRPVVPFNERVEMLCHLRHVDLVVPIPDFDKRGLSGMKMVEAIKPTVFVASKRSFKEADDTDTWVKRVEKFVGRVEIMESQAETSTSAKIRDLLMDLGEYSKQAMNEARATAIAAIETTFEEVKNRIDEVVRKA
jgi:D-beta-D-heptose 7-phosphate kinase/D-beta-D-heptose 1-phosphate adenosyltransferase